MYITNVHSKQPKSTIITTESSYIFYCLFIYFLLFSRTLNNLLLHHIWYDLQPFFYFSGYTIVVILLPLKQCIRDQNILGKYFDFDYWIVNVTNFSVDCWTILKTVGCIYILGYKTNRLLSSHANISTDFKRQTYDSVIIRALPIDIIVYNNIKNEYIILQQQCVLTISR